MSRIYIALLHHPVLDKNGEIVTTAVTNMDIHDIARSSRTYGVSRFFVVTPVRALRALAERIIDHWMTGYGSTYNETRSDALRVVGLEADLDAVIVGIERETGRRPKIVITSARPADGTMRFEELRHRMHTEDEVYLIVLGTGWGLAPEILQRGDLRLEPITGAGDYNHLSVRAAAAIVLDRLCGAR